MDCLKMTLSWYFSQNNILRPIKVSLHLKCLDMIWLPPALYSNVGNGICIKNMLNVDLMAQKCLHIEPVSMKSTNVENYQGGRFTIHQITIHHLWKIRFTKYNSLYLRRISGASKQHWSICYIITSFMELLSWSPNQNIVIWSQQIRSYLAVIIKW